MVSATYKIQSVAPGHTQAVGACGNADEFFNTIGQADISPSIGLLPLRVGALSLCTAGMSRRISNADHDVPDELTLLYCLVCYCLGALPPAPAGNGPRSYVGSALLEATERDRQFLSCARSLAVPESSALASPVMPAWAEFGHLPKEEYAGQSQPKAQR